MKVYHTFAAFNFVCHLIMCSQVTVMTVICRFFLKLECICCNVYELEHEAGVVAFLLEGVFL